MDWKFVMERMTISVHAGGLRALLIPADIVIEAELTHLRRSTRSAVHLRVDARFLHEGRPFGTATGWMRCVAPAVYQRLRGEHRQTTVDPAAESLPIDPRVVGMSTEADVVLGPALDAGVWPLRVQTEHPVLFDHPLDHVPGMLVLEGLRQAGRALLGRPDAQLAGCDVSFRRFLELDRPASVLARMPGGATQNGAALAVAVTQDGETAVSGTVEMGCTWNAAALAA
jgi:hypothetical protein